MALAQWASIQKPDYIEVYQDSHSKATALLLLLVVVVVRADFPKLGVRPHDLSQRESITEFWLNKRSVMMKVEGGAIQADKQCFTITFVVRVFDDRTV